MPPGVKGFQVGHVHSDETKAKLSAANSRKVNFNCDYCNAESKDSPSIYAQKKRHFCSQKCYSLYRKYRLPKEEQHRYGTGVDDEQTRKKKVKARSDLNHAIRDGLMKRIPCEMCGNPKSEGHHRDYDKPLEVIWLCFKHHRLSHENKELLEVVSND